MEAVGRNSFGRGQHEDMQGPPWQQQTCRHLFLGCATPQWGPLRGALTSGSLGLRSASLAPLQTRLLSLLFRPWSPLLEG